MAVSSENRFNAAYKAIMQLANALLQAKPDKVIDARHRHLFFNFIFPVVCHLTRMGGRILHCYTLFAYLYNILVHSYQGTFIMKSVSISEFRANLLKYLKIVQHGEQINVTSNGRPLATLTPPVSQHTAAKARLKELAKTAAIHDVLSPTGDSWDALK